ncbi:hypothetical protein AB0C40_03055 [Streptomyces brevispora]|uniref:hypothetical protein n=1 Tax=Streptomyces brevispora TaxID=887462 RepID=UPI002E37669B|nr:hypothetical protein [Streptomyces brevispora]
MFTSQLGRRAATVALAVTALAGAGLATAGNAFAEYAPKDGYLDGGEFGLYYNSNTAGCVFDLYSGDSNFYGDTFRPYVGSCSGQGQSTNDNTASYHNNDTYRWYVYTNSDAGGSEGNLPAGYIGNASATFKNTISSAYPYDAN